MTRYIPRVLHEISLMCLGGQTARVSADLLDDHVLWLDPKKYPTDRILVNRGQTDRLLAERGLRVVGMSYLENTIDVAQCMTRQV